MSRDQSPGNSFDYAGLVTVAPHGQMIPKPALADFRRMSRRLRR
jgi:hypothetical protein